MEVPAETAKRSPRLPPIPTFPQAWWPVRVACLAGILVVLAYLAGKSGDQLQQNPPADYDFFYHAGKWFLERGAVDPGYTVADDGTIIRRGTLDWYWPIVGRLFTPFANFPVFPSGAVWAIFNIVLLVATMRMLGREVSGFPPKDWPVTQFIPLILLGLYWTWEFTLNQLDTLTLCLLTASFVLWQRGRVHVAGFWLGLAALLKITPGLLVVWFILKRQWRTVGVALLTIALAGPIADMFIFGPGYARDLYQGWAYRAIAKGSHRGLIMHQLETDWRNQGWGAVASRWLHHTNWNTHFDNDPRAPGPAPERFMNVADLPREQVVMIVMAIMGASLLGLLYLARRPAAQMTTWQLRFEWALFMLAMLWFMPVMRRYHMIWALPMVTMIGLGIHWRGPRSAWSWAALLAVLAMPAGQLSLLLQEEHGHIIEAAGIHLATIGLLGAVGIWKLITLSREKPPAPATAAPGDDRATAGPPPPARHSQSDRAPAATAAHA
jgi:hypothetical protein